MKLTRHFRILQIVLQLSQKYQIFGKRSFHIVGDEVVRKLPLCIGWIKIVGFSSETIDQQTSKDDTVEKRTLLLVLPDKQHEERYYLFPAITPFSRKMDSWFLSNNGGRESWSTNLLAENADNQQRPNNSLLHVRSGRNLTAWLDTAGNRPQMVSLYKISKFVPSNIDTPEFYRAN